MEVLCFRGPPPESLAYKLGKASNQLLQYLKKTVGQNLFQKVLKRRHKKSKNLYQMIIFFTVRE